jgi:hypothetical protein
MPSTFLATNAEAAPYAFAFSIPVATPGLRFICRPSVVHQNAASVMDYPLSSRLDEGDGLAVFDGVLVPWERVFIHRDPEMCNGLFQRTGAMPQVMHQTSTKNLAKAEFMLALGCAIARSTNIDAHLHVQGMLAELIEHAEFRPMTSPSLLQCLGLIRPGITVHGFRSTFRDWAADQTDFPAELAELALAHQVGNRVERAYLRSDGFEKRRRLADAWAAHCG